MTSSLTELYPRCFVADMAGLLPIAAAVDVRDPGGYLLIRRSHKARSETKEARS